jgi:hypothetical protein
LRFLGLELGLEGGEVICSVFAGFGKEGVVVKSDLVEVFFQCVSGDVVLLFVDGSGVLGGFHRSIFLGLFFEVGGLAGDPFQDSWVGLDVGKVFAS